MGKTFKKSVTFTVIGFGFPTDRDELENTINDIIAGGVHRLVKKILSVRTYDLKKYGYELVADPMYEKIQSFVVELGDPIVVGLIVGWEKLSDEWIDEVRSYLEADPNILAVIPGSGVNPFKYLKDNELISKIPQDENNDIPAENNENDNENNDNNNGENEPFPQITTESSNSTMLVIGFALLALIFLMK